MKPTRKHAHLFDKFADTLHHVIHTNKSIIMIAHVWAGLRATAFERFYAEHSMLHLMHTMNIKFLVASCWA